MCQDERISKSLDILHPAESFLSSRDPILAKVIESQTARWSGERTENPIWGLLRIVMAQQISTRLACQLAQRVRSHFPDLIEPSPALLPDLVGLRALGIPEKRARCCVEIVCRSEEIVAKVKEGQTWQEALAGIKGVGPWTVSVFRIMVLREPDVLPKNDIGLQRALANLYGRLRSVEDLEKQWCPFRSVACWYLWRTLGNEQLG